MSRAGCQGFDTSGKSAGRGDHPRSGPGSRFRLTERDNQSARRPSSSDPRMSVASFRDLKPFDTSGKTVPKSDHRIIRNSLLGADPREVIPPSRQPIVEMVAGRPWRRLSWFMHRLHGAPCSPRQLKTWIVFLRLRAL